MKCPACNGTGLVYNALGDFEEDCGYCHGKGNVAEPHTNEEWFSTLSTEEKAKFFVMIEMTAMHPIKRGAVDMEKFIEEVVEWLKQPHKEKHE